MPNYVVNKVTTSGNLKHLDIYTDNKLDFNKLIPMPKELENSLYSINNMNGLLLLWQETKEKIKDGINPTKNTFLLKTIADAYRSISGKERCDIESQLKEASEQFLKLSEDEKEKIMQAGKISLANYEKCGYRDWYSWRCKNWNTKWNAIETKIINDNTMLFETAWDTPVQVMEELSKIVQGHEIEVSWADQYENHVGRVILKNGLLIKGGYLEAGTKEWIEVSREILGGSIYDE